MIGRNPESQRHPVFLGFANFYRRFHFGYSEITVPLMRLTRKVPAWHFTDECRQLLSI